MKIKKKLKQPFLKGQRSKFCGAGLNLKFDQMKPYSIPHERQFRKLHDGKNVSKNLSGKKLWLLECRLVFQNFAEIYNFKGP